MDGVSGRELEADSDIENSLGDLGALEMGGSTWTNLWSTQESSSLQHALIKMGGQSSPLNSHKIWVFNPKKAW